MDNYLWGGRDAKRYAKRVYRKIKETISLNPNIKTVIPFIAIGEIVNTMIQKGKKDKNEEMFKLIEDLKVDTPPPNKVTIDISLRILKEDERFDPTDAIIAAHALCDEYSSRLVTMDINMQSSKVLSELETELRNDRKRKRKLKISDEF